MHTNIAPWALKSLVTNEQAERIISAVAARSLSPGAAAWLQGQDQDTTGPLLSNAYEQVVWVYRAISALAEQVANIPFLFSKGERGRETLITSGPLTDFYDHPHPHFNRFHYWELRIAWLMLRGECFRVPIYEDSSGSQSLASGAPVSSVPSSIQYPESSIPRLASSIQNQVSSIAGRRLS